MTTVVLVVNAGDGAGLNFCRSLRLAGPYRIIGVDTTWEDSLVAEVDEAILIDGADRPGFIDRLHDLVASRGVDVVYAADTTAELDAVFAERGRLGAATLLPNVEDAVLEDKWATRELLDQQGIDTPATVLVDEAATLRAFMAEHGTIWLRRTHGSGGAGSLPTDSFAQAQNWVEAFGGWGSFTASERLSGRMATFSGLWFEGELLASQLRERIAWRYRSLAPSGVTGITGVQATTWDPELHELAVAAVRACSDVPHGAIGVDFTYAHDGRPLPTEIQPSRYFSSMHFLASLGCNFPALHVETARTGRPAVRGLLNPIRDRHYWVKAVDRLPVLLTEAELERARGLG